MPRGPLTAGVHGLTRKRLAIIATIAVLLAAVVLNRTSMGAKADSQSSTVSMTCAALGLNVPADIPMTVVDTPDPAVAGGDITVDISSSLPSFGVTATLFSATFTVPVPAAVATVNNVTFIGGNVNGSYVVNSSGIAMTITAPTAAGISTDALVPPKMSISATFKTTAGGQTADWQAFSNVTSAVKVFGQNVTASCTPGTPGQVLNTTQINAPEPTTTTTVPEPTTTTTVPEPTTTTTVPEPTTTTTAPQPTTTTTVPEPTTTTTKAPHHGDSPLVKIIKILLKFLNALFGFFR